MSSPQSAAVGPAAGPLTISGSPTAATQNVAYSWSPSVDGGTPPYSFSKIAGSVPAGMSFHATRPVIDGTPSGTGTSSGIQIRVTDSASPTPATADETVSIVVSAQLVLTNAPATTANINSAYSYAPTTTGGRAPLTWAITNKPSWSSFSTSTGALTGTTPGSSETDTGIVIVGTDADGRTVTTGTFQIAISSSPASAITQVEVMGVTALDPIGPGPYSVDLNGYGLRVRFPCTVAGPLTAIDPSKFSVAIGTSGYDNNNGAGPISASNFTLTVVPTAVLRVQAAGGTPDPTTTTQIQIQGGVQTASPTLVTPVDVFLMLPIYVLPTDTVTVTVANNWNGGGTTGGSCPACTNSSTIDDTAVSHPIYGWFEVPQTYVHASTLDIELQVAYHREGRIGGKNTHGQMVPGVDIWATDGTNNGTVTQVTQVSLSNRQTREGRAEVFRASALSLSALTPTDGTNTLGPGRAYVTAKIYPWRGTPYIIHTQGVAWPTRQPCTVHPFTYDPNGIYGNSFAPVRSDGLLLTAAITGVVTTYPAGRPTAAASYNNIDNALKALAAFHNQTLGRPASPILHASAAGGRALLVDNNGVDQAFEIAATITPASTGNCMAYIEPWSGNTARAYYNVSTTRRFDGGCLHLKCEVQRTVPGGISANDGTNQATSPLFALDGALENITTISTNPFFLNCAMVYFFNVNKTGLAGGTTSLLQAGFGSLTASSYTCAKAIGVTLGDINSSQPSTIVIYHYVGVTGRFLFSDPNTTRQTTNDGFILYNCKSFANFTSSDPQMNGSYDYTRGFAIGQNVWEGLLTSGANNGVNYNSEVINVRNAAWFFNSGIATNGDINDDRGGVSFGYRNKTALLGTKFEGAMFGNIQTRYSMKGDWEAVHAEGSAVGNNGNYPVTYGLYCYGNLQVYQGRTIDIGGTQFDWRAADPQTAANIAAGAVAYTSAQCIPAAGWSAGIGYGDYSLAAGANVAKGVILAGAAYLYADIAGTVRKNAVSGATNTSGAAGAFEATD